MTAPRFLVAWLAALAALLATPAGAQSFPKFTGLVVDAANMLPADRKAALEQKLEAFQQTSAKQGRGRQLVVATVPSLEGQDIQQYGVALLRTWGVGLKGANTGVILLVAPAEHKIGIETGPGVSGVLTDAYSSVIINSKIVPAFKAGDMPAGIEAGADGLIDILSQPDDEAKAKVAAAIAAYDKDHKRQSGGEGLPLALLFPLVIFGVILTANMMRRSRYGRPYGDSNWPILLWGMSELFDSHRSGGWGGGSGGGGSDSGGGWGDGGFTGGGGGSGDGGGASGSW